MNQEAKALGETLVCQAPEDHQEYRESRDEMAPEGILVMLDQEARPDQQDQKEMVEDLVLAILDQEDHQVKEVRRETVGLEAAEGTVVRKVNQEIKEYQENLASQGLRVNLDKEVQEERVAVMVMLALREIPDSLNVM